VAGPLCSPGADPRAPVIGYHPAGRGHSPRKLAGALPYAPASC